MLSKNDCLQLMCDMLMPEHIVVHSIQVCRVATCLTDHLTSKGNHLNGQLVQAAALLHDITKSRSFETAENHALTGGQQLTDLGYAAIGNLVRQHVRLDEYSDPNDISEAVIVNYADKRVLHDRIVSLDERMRYIQQRYGT
ncbi:MAG: HD domain-containing protein, partial [Desulfobacterales bacterium]